MSLPLDLLQQHFCDEQDLKFQELIVQGPESECLLVLHPKQVVNPSKQKKRIQIRYGLYVECVI